MILVKQKTKKIIKTVVIGSLIATIFLASRPSLALEDFKAEAIYEFKEESHIGAGLKHEHINTYTTKGLWDINVIRIDMTNEYTELKGLINPEGLSYRDTVSNMVNKHQALAGVNGDYFNTSPISSAMGTMINNGKMISSPVERAFALPTFYLDTNNQANIDYFDRNISIKNLETDNIIMVNTLNKMTPKFDSLTLLDTNWGYSSAGSRYHKDLTEVLIEDGIVIEKRTGGEAFPIKQNSYVLAGRQNAALPLASLNVGDRVEITINSSPNIENIKFAIGGGSTILKNGEITNTNIVDYSRHPRTGIAVNKDNTEIILVTLDGRSSKSTGISQKDFGRVLRSLGAYHGLNLDGGGSTTMAIRKPENNYSTVVNKPSGGSQRKVVNSVGVFSNAPESYLNRVELVLENKSMFQGSSNYISLRGVNPSGKTLDINPNGINISIIGEEFTFENNLLRANKPGKLLVKAVYTDPNTQKQYSTEKTIEVYETPIDIYSKDKELSIINNQELSLAEFYGKDREAREARIPLRDLNLEIIGNIGEIKEGKLLVNDNPESGFIHASFGLGSHNIKLISESDPVLKHRAPEATVFSDSLNIDTGITSPDGFKISFFSDTSNISPERYSMFINTLKQQNIAVSLNGFSEKLMNNMPNTTKINAVGGYKVNKRGDLYIVNLDTRNGGLRQSNSYQWMRVKNELKKRPETNIILTSSRSIFGPGGFNDPYEAEALHKNLVDIKNTGKNVFFVYNGMSYGGEMKDGIRYLKVDSIKEKSQDSINNLSLLEFTVNGSDINYSFKKVFK